MSQRQYVGFDVGGWLVRSSQDAVARLIVEGETRTWDLLSRDAKGRRKRNVLHPGKISSVMEDLFETVDAIPTIIAVDAALGWPTDFSEIMQQRLPHSLPSIDGKSIDNKVLYRETERFVYHAVKTMPLTAVGDMFGNPSAKAPVTALRIRDEYAAYMPPFDQWSRQRFCKSRLSIVEVYPASIRKSSNFSNKVEAELARINKKLRAIKQEVLTDDEEDAVRCALIAEDLHYAVCIGSNNPDRVYDLPDGDDTGKADSGMVAVIDKPHSIEYSIDFDRVGSEGWISTPRQL